MTRRSLLLGPFAIIAIALTAYLVVVNRPSVRFVACDRDADDGWLFI